MMVERKPKGIRIWKASRDLERNMKPKKKGKKRNKRKWWTVTEKGPERNNTNKKEYNNKIRTAAIH